MKNVFFVFIKSRLPKMDGKQLKEIKKLWLNNELTIIFVKGSWLLFLLKEFINL